MPLMLGSRQGHSWRMSEEARNYPLGWRSACGIAVALLALATPQLPKFGLPPLFAIDGARGQDPDGRNGRRRTPIHVPCGPNQP